MKATKIIFLFFLLTSCFLSAIAQRGQYKIKIVETKKKTRGVFYKAENDGLTLIKNNGDTLKIPAEQIKSLYIHKRSIVAPITIAATIVAVAFLSNSGATPLQNFVAIFVGVPLGASVGLLAGDLIANKRYYTKLEAKDFPQIKADLQKYTVVR